MYEAIIGLEIHVQLATASKMFCRCDNRGEDQPPNTTVCPVCLGHPGTLPVVNRDAIRLGAKAALALHATVNPLSRFDRKSYFYPDLPKGYQISQYDQPLATNGYLTLANGRRIHLERVHLEEDAAKLIHDAHGTAVDFNRAGTPLLEIVSTPDLRSPTEAKTYAEAIQRLMRWIGVSLADMEKGHLRVDANISLRPIPELPIEGESTAPLYPKTEIKNINSFRALERALGYEIVRQTELWNRGEPPSRQSTRGWDVAKGETVLQREKEEAADYRYFPEPDLPPLSFSEAEIGAIRAELPEPPEAMWLRFQEQYGFAASDALHLMEDRAVASFAEHTVSELRAWIVAKKPKDRGVTWHTHKADSAKLIANWLLNRLLPFGQGGVPSTVTAENFAEFLTLVFDGAMNAPTAQHVLEVMVATKKDPSDILRDEGLEQVSDENTIDSIVDEVLAAHPEEVARFKAGKTPLLQFFVGKVMAKAQGKANPKVVSDRIVHKLK